MQKLNLTRVKGIFVQIAIYISVILLWQGVFYIGVNQFQWWKPYAFPNPEGVLQSFIKLSKGGELYYAILYSLGRAFTGFAFAILLGLAMGILLVRFKTLNKAFKPAIVGIQSLPSICWVPFAILWFGLKEQAIIFVVIMGTMFSISLSIDSAVKNIKPLYLKAGLTLGASKKDLYIRIILPASLPSLIAGVRQAWSFSWRALMSAEVMSASIGLGYTLILGRDLADINQVMLVMIIIIFVGVLIDSLIFSKIEAYILKKRGMSVK